MSEDPKDLRDWSGRVAVVTGATQGLGEQVARLLAARGVSGIVITGRNAERGEALAAELTSNGNRTVFIPAELTDTEQCATVIARADEEFGTLHALINCAGVSRRDDVWNATVEEWDFHFAVNVRAQFFLGQAAARIMRREGVEGTITSVGSTSGYGGQPYLATYAIAKGALMSMTKTMAFTLMKHRIRVNIVNPGWMDTPAEDVTQRTLHGATDGWQERAAEGLPFGRLIDPKELARTLLFVASPESGLMTGAIIDYDQTVLGASEEPPTPDMTTIGTEIPSVSNR